MSESISFIQGLSLYPQVLSASDLERRAAQEKEIEMEFDALRLLPEQQKRTKNDDIKEMLRYYNHLSDATGDMRTRIYQFSAQYLVVLGAATGVIFSQSDRFPPLLLYSVLTLLTSQIAFSVGIIAAYVLQSGYRYFFLKERKYGNKWKWFYYGNRPVTGISTKLLPPPIDYTETWQPYLEGMKNYVHNYATETLDDELVNNIQQLYLMQVVNYYENRFYLQLNRIQISSLKVLLATIIIVAVCVIYISWPSWVAKPGSI